MERCPAHSLIELSDDDSWSLFKHHAFGHNIEESEELVAIGKCIVGKCVGSPLAIKTLGSLLCDESEVRQWQNVKESEIWDIQEENSLTSEETSILRALKLSYVNLGLSLRRCFSFCAIFPKGFEIVKEELIHLWMANGFIKSKGNLEVEDVGNKVWKKLYGRSFFQEAKSDKFGIIRSFKMHDLFQDLAQAIMGEECVVYGQTRCTNLSSRVHHLHLLTSNELGNKAALKKVESIRTFLDVDSYKFTENFRLLPSNSCLRALRISFGQLSPVMNLAHLRYLNVRGSWVTCLPNSICRLQKLQILKLEDCDYLYRLPKDLTRLQDLRHLVINKCNSIIVMPPNIGRLSHLRTLSSFIVGSKPGYGLAELHDLKLGGKLHIRGLENVPSEWHAKEANLISKRELNRLYLSWGRSEGSNVNSERVLEALEPPSTLKSFGMKRYQGIQFSNWLRNPSVLKDLVDLILDNCNNCEELPPLGKLPHLKSLFVSGMKDVKYIDNEPYDGVEKAFPLLTNFTMRDLPHLERMLRDEGVEMLPRLSKLSIEGVPKLKFPRIPSGEHLEVWGIEDATSLTEEVVGNMPCLKTLGINFCDELKVLPDQFCRLSALQELHITGCNELESFPEHVLQGLTCLRVLNILMCEKLKILSEGVRHLVCLEFFYVAYCPKLLALPRNMNKLTALREVYICGTLPEGLQCIPSLQILVIAGCSSLPDWLGDMTSLRELCILDCRELSSLPPSIQRLTNLAELKIDNCPQLEKRCKRETGQDWQYIAHIPQLQLFSHPEIKTSTLICERIRSFWTVCNTIGIRSALNFWQDDSQEDAFDVMVEA